MSRRKQLRPFKVQDDDDEPSANRCHEGNGCIVRAIDEAEANDEPDGEYLYL